jgi:hypothetical protein
MQPSRLSVRDDRCARISALSRPTRDQEEAESSTLNADRKLTFAN